MVVMRDECVHGKESITDQAKALNGQRTLAKLTEEMISEEYTHVITERKRSLRPVFQVVDTKYYVMWWVY